MSLILSLNGSSSFATTHAVINDLLSIEGWKKDECEMLIDIALSNSQVLYILNDEDVKKFYKKIIKILGHSSRRVKEIEGYLE
jgi:hypothetical protein